MFLTTNSVPSGRNKTVFQLYVTIVMSSDIIDIPYHLLHPS